MVELVVGLLNAGAGVQADDIGVMATYRKQVRRGRSTLRQCMNAVLAKGLPRSVLALQANCPIPRPTTPHNVCCSLTGPEDPAAAAPAWPGSHPGGHRRRLPGAGEPHMCTANFDEQGMPPGKQVLAGAQHRPAPPCHTHGRKMIRQVLMGKSLLEETPSPQLSVPQGAATLLAVDSAACSRF